VVLLVSLIKYIKGQLSREVNRMKPLSAEQSTVSSQSMGVIEKLEKKWGKSKGKEAGVFLFLYCQMWLQAFTQPGLATEVLEELGPVHLRWSKGDKKTGAEEPAWIEVVTEILISLLAQNNHLLRNVVGAVFSVIGREMTAPAMDSILAVIKKKDGDDQDDDAGEDSEDEEIDDEVEEDDNEKDSSEDDTDSSEEEDEEQADDSVVDPALLSKLSGALGDHAADSESDLDMDEVPDEDMAKLDEKLVEAFKALGGRKDGLGKKKAAISSLANMHFKLRVLELVELYLSHSPKPAMIVRIVPALIESLDKALRSESSAEPLVNRVLSVLGKASRMKVEEEVSTSAGEELVEVLTSLMELASSGSAVVNTLGNTFPRLVTFLLRLGEEGGKVSELQALYSKSLDAFLHQPSCVLPTTVFTLAMSHSWPGCWALANTLASASFNSDVRQFRKVASLALLASLLQNKSLVSNNEEEVKKVVEKLSEPLTQELSKVKDMIGKAKPKFLCEMFSVLLAIKNSPFDASFDWGLVGEDLKNIGQVWPPNKWFARAKTVLMKLARKCGAEIEFAKPVIDSNGETFVGEQKKEIKKKNKKKKKSQQNLKKAKEMKLEMAAAQDNSDVPSFASLVQDNINDESTESKKRKVGIEEEGPPAKAKKAKKKNNMDEETPVKIKKAKKKATE